MPENSYCPKKSFDILIWERIVQDRAHQHPVRQNSGSVMNMIIRIQRLRPFTFSGVFANVWKGVAALLLIISHVGQANAAWFEAQGQALIAGQSKEEARQQATAEALRQAMLFAGASVHSVQTLANGLLTEETFEVQANGEVNQLELIDEVWHKEYVSVRIRADIFPKPEQCAAAGFQKTLVTTHFPIQYPRQALDGQISRLSQILPRELQQQFSRLAPAVSVQAIAPFSVNWYRQDIIEQAPTLARQHQAQYILGATVSDISVERPAHSSYAFWKDPTAQRHFTLTVNVLDGMHGGSLMNKTYQISAPWQFERTAQVDVASATFWRSAYGQAVEKELATLVTDVESILACQPATGRVVQVAGNSLQVSIGRTHGLKVGDILFVYQTARVTGPFGQTFTQYNLYPTQVEVTAAFADSATVKPVDNGLLINIQPNDYVAKR